MWIGCCLLIICHILSWIKKNYIDELLLILFVFDYVAMVMIDLIDFGCFDFELDFAKWYQLKIQAQEVSVEAKKEEVCAEKVVEKAAEVVTQGLAEEVAEEVAAGVVEDVVEDVVESDVENVVECVVEDVVENVVDEQIESVKADGDDHSVDQKQVLDCSILTYQIRFTQSKLNSNGVRFVWTYCNSIWYWLGK